jgi:predicted nuclease with TOPRIM domain
MSNKAKKFIYNYDNNKSEYDNGYIVFNPSFINNTIWFRFNNIKIDWEWSNDLIYWNKNYNKNNKCGIWVNSLLDRGNDINFIINYLRIKGGNKNIQVMTDKNEKTKLYNDESYTINTPFKKKNRINKIGSDNKISNIELNNAIGSEPYMDMSMKHTLNIENTSDFIKIDKSVLLNLNNNIGILHNELFRYSNDINMISHHFYSKNNDIDKTNILYQSFLYYQKSLLTALNCNYTNSSHQNTYLMYERISQLNEKLDNQIFENSQLNEKLDNQIFEISQLNEKLDNQIFENSQLNEKLDNQIFENSQLNEKLDNNTINENKSIIRLLELSNKNLELEQNLLKNQISELILEIELYKNTQEGNYIKIMGISKELEQKNTIISHLKLYNENIVSSVSILSPNLEYDIESNIFRLKEDYEILNLDELV